jgi:hypothetical protein
MLDRIPVNVIDVIAQIFFIANSMLPKAALPDSSLASFDSAF